MKYWLLSTIFVSTSCLSVDDKDKEAEESQPTSESSADPIGEDSDDQGQVYYITQNFSGAAAVVSGSSYEGSEILRVASNLEPETGIIESELIYSVSGTSIDSPTECTDCQFAFALQLTFDAEASIDPSESGQDISFSYAYGTSEEGADTVFYKGAGSWTAWLVNGSESGADNGLRQEASFDGTSFIYNDNLIDFYYYY